MNKHYSLSILCLLFLTVTNLNSQTIWTGPSVTFTKADNADWTLEENQDRITNAVWITRQNNQSIFNIAVESEQQGNGNGSVITSPADTEWAVGSISDGIGNLTFDNFVATLNGEVGDNVFNGPMVLHLISEDIYIDITFNSWSSGNSGGGFSYTRSSDQTLSTDNFELNKVKVFPNPSTNFIQVHGLLKETAYTIYNVLGKEIRKGVTSAIDKIDVQRIPEGTYFLKLNGKEAIRFIKE